MRTFLLVIAFTAAGLAGHVHGASAQPLPFTLAQPFTGDNQSVALTSTGSAELSTFAAIFQPISVTVRGLGTISGANQTVTFTCLVPTGATCVIGAGTSSVATVASNADGVATLKAVGNSRGAIVVSGAPGAFTVTARIGTASVVFRLTTTAPPHNLTAVVTIGGDQREPEGTAASGGIASFNPITIAVTDGGKPVSGVPILWTCQPAPGLKCRLNAQNALTVQTITDATGKTTLDFLPNASAWVSQGDGPVELIVTNPQLQQQPMIKLTALPNTPPSQ